MPALPDVSLGDADLPTEGSGEEVHSQVPDPQTDQVPETGSGPRTDLVLASPDLGPLPRADLPSPTGPERALAVVHHWVRQAVETFTATASRPGGLGSAQPESWQQYRARVAARPWLPEGHRGGWMEWVPVVFYFTVSPVLWAVCTAGQWLSTHALAFFVAFGLTAVVIVLWSLN